MKIVLIEEYFDNYYCFSIDRGKDFIFTSRKISQAFNTLEKIYVNTLINKVIKHEDYIFCENYQGRIFNVVFKLNDTSEEVYIERFKNIFTEELTNLVLGGFINES